MLKSIIFDCDGVLLDTLEANRYFYDAILERLGYPRLSQADLHAVHAMTVKEAFDHVMTPEDALRAPAVAHELDREIYVAHVKVPDHLHNLLAKLKTRFRLGVVTNRDARGVQALADFDLLQPFDAIISASDVACPKPNPEGLLKICRIFGISPAEGLFVGDSAADYKAAAAAQMPFVAYNSPIPETVTRVANMRELDDYINSLSA